MAVLLAMASFSCMLAKGTITALVSGLKVSLSETRQHACKHALAYITWMLVPAAACRTTSTTFSPFDDTLRGHSRASRSLCLRGRQRYFRNEIKYL